MKIISSEISNLNNYFDFHVCLSFCLSTVHPFVRKLAPIPAVVLQNVTNKSCLACIKSEKYASCVTLRPQCDCCHQGEAEVRILNFKITWSELQEASQTATEQGLYLAGEFQIYSIVTSPPHCRSQAVVCISTPRMYLRSGYFLI